MSASRHCTSDSRHFIIIIQYFNNLLHLACRERTLIFHVQRFLVFLFNVSKPSNQSRICISNCLIVNFFGSCSSSIPNFHHSGVCLYDFFPFIVKLLNFRHVIRQYSQSRMGFQKFLPQYLKSTKMILIQYWP